MNFKAFFKDTSKTSKVATLIIFLAIIRCIVEPFRLQNYAVSMLTFADIKPFLLGALVAASGLLVMIVLSYYKNYRGMIATCILTIVGLLIVKMVYF